MISSCVHVVSEAGKMWQLWTYPFFFSSEWIILCADQIFLDGLVVRDANKNQLVVDCSRLLSEKCCTETFEAVDKCHVDVVKANADIFDGVKIFLGI